jgi:hypothetical protein
MKKKNGVDSSFESSKLTHDIHSFVFPYFSRWQNSHGNYIRSQKYILYSHIHYVIECHYTSTLLKMKNYKYMKKFTTLLIKSLIGFYFFCR